jgi:hypothetical protein
MDLASNIGGKIEKDDVLSAVEKCVYLSLSFLFFFLSFLFFLIMVSLWFLDFDHESVLLISLCFSYMK